MPAELSNGAAARQLASDVAAKFQRIDILVHLVGTFAGGKPVYETDDDTIERMLDTNLKSAFHMIGATLPYMRAQGGGRILAIGSRAAVEASPGATEVASGTSNNCVRQPAMNSNSTTRARTAHRSSVRGQVFELSDSRIGRQAAVDSAR